MKARIVAGLLASLLLLTAASAEAGPKKRSQKHVAKPAAAAKHVSKRRAKSTKQAATVQASLITNVSETPAPAPEPEAAKAEARPSKSAIPGLSRFVASGVPLAEVREGRIKGVGTAKQPCGAKARWAKTASKWQALDAWGRVTGTLTVGGSERYDGTGCHRIWFTEGTGSDALGVFVAAGSGYSAGASAEWKADDSNKRRFESLYAAQESAWVEGKNERPSLQRRTMYFKLPAQEASVEGSPTQRRAIHWAVSGGRVLVVGYIGATGAWKVGHVLPPNGKVNAYEPLAVLDMNGDGLPEIVVHEEAGGVFNDRVLSFDAGSMRWETALESPGGASR